MTYQRKTDDEIKALARRVYRNEVFVSWSIDSPTDLPMVFMILSLLDRATVRRLIDDDIQFFYEDYDKAGPTSVNGYPVFFSCHFLNREDGKRLHARVKEIAELVG
jgi:hypothetical protein